ncbi:DinB family protein [Tenacibaculum aiptasiae]|uniref:DinB family protein n=1 Tax=Tenacibaculum aiptasiae TaxID=426481 RepID=A0A7J5A4S2_9FLAO|nr:DinB family protein [Tenacibaculum aiptasiae]KAB1151411.1 DinB family protein [Tenacibaculum aiptasiae]
MTETTNKLEDLLQKGLDYFSKTYEEEISKKLAPEKWSKKEILGHLIDSGINNLQRFTEIQFENKPYRIRKYNQNELVIANDYQNAQNKELLGFWIAINNRILNIMKLQTEESLNYKIELSIDNTSDLRFLMTDYVDHLEHHLNQIIK